jgi:uncharacterized protein (TIGR02757 family)
MKSFPYHEPVAADRSQEIAEFLESIYSSCNVSSRLDRDPLAIVSRFPGVEDREIAGMVCSTLAFGGVDLIMRACESALGPLGDHPAVTLDSMTERDVSDAWGSFQYRFCFPKDIIALFKALQSARRQYGSLQGLFLAGYDSNCQEGRPLVQETSHFVNALRRLGGEGCDEGAKVARDVTKNARNPAGQIRMNLLPDPADGSACKRIFLFLRWMVRHDTIDPGGWGMVSPSRLVVPLDVHMFRTCKERLGFFAQADRPARRLDGRENDRQGSGPRTPNLAAALRATAMFRLYAPDDPVKFDFALTRPGIDPRPGDEIFACL